MSEFNHLNYVNVGPNGTFKKSGRLMTAPADIDALFQHLTHSEPQKLVVFFHGGLVNEEKGLAIAGKMWQAFRDHAYPVTFIWETGFLETLTNHLDSIHRTKLFQKILRLIISQATKRLSGVLGARGTAKIFMPHVSQGFNPSDRYTQVVDAAVTTLQQGGDFFPKDAIDFLLREKFYDPMLGLLGAHFLLRRADLRENYVHIVLDNLENLIPGSPDVQALRLMAAECLGWDIPRTPFDRAHLAPRTGGGPAFQYRLSGVDPGKRALGVYRYPVLRGFSLDQLGSGGGVR